MFPERHVAHAAMPLLAEEPGYPARQPLFLISFSYDDGRDVGGTAVPKSHGPLSRVGCGH